MILGFEPASKDSSFTLNTVFSLGFSCKQMGETNSAGLKTRDVRQQAHRWQQQQVRRRVQLLAWQFLGYSVSTVTL
jgi:hypothetical protein